MKLILLCFAISLYAQTVLEYPTLTKDMFKNEKYLSFLVKVLNKNLIEQNFKDIKLTIKNDEVAFRKAFKKGKYRIVALTPMQYFKYENFYKKYSKKKFAPRLNGDYFVKYYLLGNPKDKNILENMEKYKVSFVDSHPISEIWLNYMLIKDNRAFPKSIEYSAKANTIVNNVFFKKNRLAVVSKNTYDILNEINPQIKQYTKILLSSKKIYFNLITLLHKDISKKDENSFIRLEKEIEVFFENTSLSFGGKLKGGKILEDRDILELKNIVLNYQKLNP